MGDTPQWENIPATLANKAWRKAVDIMVGVAEAAVFAEVPYLNFWIVRDVVKFVIGKFGDFVYIYVATKSTMVIIDFQTIEERIKYESATEKLRFAISTGDVERIHDADKEFDEALGRAVHWDGSAHPKRDVHLLRAD